MYNSDGYILLDFAKVNFSKTNQIIDGLYARVQSIVGTNKFVIVINANNKTPLPSTVAFTNNKYVIESVLFTFEISSNDNLKITKKTTIDSLIDDQHTTLNTTWSSLKIANYVYDSISAFAFGRINGTLEAGETTITFTNTLLINDDTEFDFYTSKFGVIPTNAVVNEHTLTLTFEEQATDIDVQVRVYNYGNV